MSDDRTIREVVTTGCSLVTTVRIYEQSWSAKVALDHGDVSYTSVIKTLEDPCVVCESKTQPGSLVFVNQVDTNQHGHALRVPVKVYADGTGTFKSAYYSGASSHGKVVWSRGDD